MIPDLFIDILSYMVVLILLMSGFFYTLSYIGRQNCYALRRIFLDTPVCLNVRSKACLSPGTQVATREIGPVKCLVTLYI